jgi:hypothetical protein
MDDNEKTPPQSPESDKRLKLDLSEAMNQGADDDDDIIELKDEVTLPTTAKEEDIGLRDQLNDDMQGDALTREKIIDIDTADEETDGEEAVAHLVDDFVFGEEDQAGSEIRPIEDDLSLKADLADDEDNVAHLVDDLVFEDEDEDTENVVRLADDLAFEEEDEEMAEILPLVDEEPLKADADDEVVEITEFDDFLSDDSNEMITLTDVGEELEPEDEFLELFDIEEDDLTAEDNVPEMVAETAHEEIENDIIQFDGPGVNDEDTELEDFINDSLGEEIRIDDDFEDDLTSALGVEAGSDINMADPASGSEEFDFNMDSSKISEKIEQLETIFFDESEEEDELNEDDESEPEAILSAVSDTGDETDDQVETIFFDESEAEDELDEDAESEPEMIEAAESDTGDETDEISEKIARLETTFFDEAEAEDELDEDAESETEAIKTGVFDTGDETDEEDLDSDEVEPAGEPPSDGAMATLAGASQEQIEKSIERIIQENFSDRIESLVTETIEKAVSKEIDRLKNILLDDGNDETV